VIRVFPRSTKWTPKDQKSYVGDPPLWFSTAERIRVSVTFTWDIPEGRRLFRAYASKTDDIQIGGPAFDDPGGEFVPGRFIKEGVTITSRGCIRKCGFCLVPKREGKIRELPIEDGWIVQDNNLLACSQSHIEAVFEMLRRQPEPIEFSGLDARLLKPWHIEQIKSLRLGKAWFAMDNDNLRPLSIAGDLLKDIPTSKKFCYVLIGFGDETMSQAEKRLREVWKLGFYPFAMLYRGPNGEGHKNQEWKRFQRTWCRPAAYKAFLKGIDTPMEPAI
jgi:hypothetical protein